MLEILNPHAIVNDAGHIAGVTNENRERTVCRQWQVLDAGANPATLSGTTNNTVLQTVVIPGGMLGPAAMIRATAIYSANNNANTKTPRLRFGAFPFYSAGLSAWVALTAQGLIVCRNSPTLAIATPVNVASINGGTSQPLVPITIDMSVDQTVTFEAQLANASDTIVLEAWCVEVLPSF